MIPGRISPHMSPQRQLHVSMWDAGVVVDSAFGHVAETFVKFDRADLGAESYATMPAFSSLVVQCLHDEATYSRFAMRSANGHPLGLGGVDVNRSQTCGTQSSATVNVAFIVVIDADEVHGILVMTVEFEGFGDRLFIDEHRTTQREATGQVWGGNGKPDVHRRRLWRHCGRMSTLPLELHKVAKCKMRRWC